MPNVIEAKRLMAELGTKAKEVLADDSLTNAEKKTRLDQYQEDLKSYSDTIALHEQAQRLVAGGESAPEAKADEQRADRRSFAQQVVESDSYKAVKAGTHSAGITIKATANTIDEGTMPTYSGGSGEAGQLLAPQFLPGVVPLLFQPLYVADLMASGTTDAVAVTYVIEAAFNDNTATVKEKALKPQLDLTLARRQDNVKKIANIAKLSDEMFKDAPQFQAYLQNRMIFGIQRQEEHQLLNGTGTDPDITGLLNRPGLAPAIVTTTPADATKLIEGIFNQITQLRTVSFVEPDAIVINPTDWQTIRLGKDANGQYFAGGPFTGAYGNPGPSNVENLWGYRVVITTAMAQGSALVGGFRQNAQVFRKEGITVEMTNSNVDDFQNDLITLRTEERLALAVYRPAGFGLVTFTA